MRRSKSIAAGFAVLAFSAAVHAGPHGLLIVSPETRDALGNDLIEFADRNIVNQPYLPVISDSDCSSDGKYVALSFRKKFVHPIWTADTACEAFGDAFWKSSGGYYEFSNRIKGKSILHIIDLARTMDDVSQSMGMQDKNLDLPGTPKDWNAHTLFHELKHSRDHANGTRVAETAEYSADSGAAQYYRQAYRLGLVSDPSVPNAMRAIRVIEDISNPNEKDTHNMALLAGLPDVGPDKVRTPEMISQSFEQARTAIYHEIAPTSLVAIRSARYNPHLLYQAARKLYREGAFEKDPVQKAYAREFLRAAETYGARYYETKSKSGTAPSLHNKIR